MIKYEDLATPTIVAKWFETTPNNVRRTYVHNKPKIYRLQCAAAYMMENGIKAKELVTMVALAKAMRKSSGK